MSEIDLCLQRAAQERDLAASVVSPASRDDHIMLAERWLDRAWSLNEADEGRPPMETEMWH